MSRRKKKEKKCFVLDGSVGFEFLGLIITTGERVRRGGARRGGMRRAHTPGATTHRQSQHTITTITTTAINTLCTSTPPVSTQLRDAIETERATNLLCIAVL